jgi:hypothetical protein
LGAIAAAALGRDGQRYAAAAPPPSLAPTSEQLVPIARYLYHPKVQKQATVLATANPKDAQIGERRAATIDQATTVEHIAGLLLDRPHTTPLT